MIRSARWMARFTYASPCMPIMPERRANGSPGSRPGRAGSAPPGRSALLRQRGAGRATRPRAMMPCPARISGRSLDAIRSAARARWSALRRAAPGRGGSRRLVRPLERRARLLHVLADVDQHRAGAPRAAAIANASRSAGASRVDVGDQLVVLRDGQRDAGDVRLLEGVAAEQLRRHLARDEHGRHRVEHGGRDAGRQVGGARARGRDRRRPRARWPARSRRPCARRPARGAPARGGSGSVPARRRRAGWRRRDSRRRCRRPRGPGIPRGSRRPSSRLAVVRLRFCSAMASSSPGAVTAPPDVKKKPPRSVSLGGSFDLAFALPRSGNPR